MNVLIIVFLVFILLYLNALDKRYKRCFILIGDILEEIKKDIKEHSFALQDIFLDPKTYMTEAEKEIAKEEEFYNFINNNELFDETIKKTIREKTKKKALELALKKQRKNK